MQIQQLKSHYSKLILKSLYSRLIETCVLLSISVMVFKHFEEKYGWAPIMNVAGIILAIVIAAIVIAITPITEAVRFLKALRKKPEKTLDTL